MDKNNNPFLNPEWLGLQQQYIDALSSFNSAYRKNSSVQPGNGQQAWSEALGHWRKAVENFLPGEGKPLFGNILNQTGTFYSIAGDFAGMLHDISSTDTATEDWRSIMAAHMARMKAQFDACPSGNKSQYGSPMFQSALLENWKSMVNAMSGLPEEVFENAVQDNIEKLIERFAALPGLGPTRELQEKLADSIRLWKDYQHKLHEYESVLAQLGKLALERLEQKIIGLADSNNKITSLKQIYNLWIDANEEVFARFAFNADHAKLYGELINALMRYRIKFNEIMDEVLAAMNMPTGAAMQTVYKRQQQMRNALRDSLGIQQQLQRHFEQLQADLERIRSAVGKPAKSRSTGTEKHKQAARKPS